MFKFGRPSLTAGSAASATAAAAAGSTAAASVRKQEEPVVAAEPLPLDSLVAREVAVKAVTASEATLTYALPPTSTTVGGAVDVRIMVRPAKLFRDTSLKVEELSRKVAELNMKWSMQSLKLQAEQRQEKFMEHSKETAALKFQMDALWDAYYAKRKQLLPPPATGDGEETTYRYDLGFAAVHADLAHFVSFAKFSEVGPVTISASPETNTVTLANLASNTFFEVCIVAKRAASSTLAEDDSSGSMWSPARSAKVVGFTTRPAPWQLALEKAGLSHLIAPFSERGYADFATWPDIPHDVKMELGIDSGVEIVLGEILAREGIVTPQERERLDKEKAEMVGVVATLVSEYRLNSESLGVGDAVTDKAAKRFGVVVSPPGADGNLSVRWEDSQTRDPANSAVVGGIKVQSVTRASFNVFLSHAQAEAQNQVAHLSVILRDRGMKIWFDMDSERLEARDMVRGIANSKVFLLYLTKSYFERFFCRLEASVARALKKQIIIVYEPDERFGGFGDYVKLVKVATLRYPEFSEFLLGVEAIPMARRAFQRRAVVDEICKRSGVTSSSAASSSSGGGGGGGGGGGDADLRQAILDLRMDINDLREENRELRQLVESLQTKLQ